MVLRNYKSIRFCDVQLGPLTFLVGPNGAGKSNFVEALHLLSYALKSTLEQAIANHSGFHSILSKGENICPKITFQIDCEIGNEGKCHYAVEIEATPEGPVVINSEECSMDSPGRNDWFKVKRGVVESNQGVAPAASEDSLYLVNASGMRPFGPIYRTLSNLTVYNPEPDEIRGFKAERSHRLLDRTGSGLAEVVFHLKQADPENLLRITEYLQRIDRSLLAIDPVSFDGNYNLRFRMNTGNTIGQDFWTQNMSDGTLRALAVLVALFQSHPVSVIALEEPETGLHPAAAGLLFDSLVEGSHLRQVVVTTHSPDLLDRKDVPMSSIRAVMMDAGQSYIGGVDEFGKRAISELYSPGELLRMDLLRPKDLPLSALFG